MLKKFPQIGWKLRLDPTMLLLILSFCSCIYFKLKQIKRKGSDATKLDDKIRYTSLTTYA